MAFLLGRVADALLQERERWPLWVPVAIGVGVAVYFGMPVEPPLWAGPAMAFGAGALAWFGRSRMAVLLPAIAAAALAAGFTAGQARTAIVAAPMLAYELDGVEVAGDIVALEPLPGARRIVLASPSIAGIEDRLPAKLRLRVVGAGSDLRLGDHVRVRASLGPPSPPSVPGVYDFQRHAFFEGIGAVGFAYGKPVVLRPAASSRLGSWFDGLRLAMTERIQARLPGATGAVAVALIAGAQSAIPKADLQAMRDSGLAHLLSISGLHMAILAGILFVGLRAGMALIPPLALNHPIKKWAAVAALFGTLFYLLLSGAPVPAQRAFIMTGLVLVAVLVDRSAISMRLVAWAALVLLLLRPEALIGPSFQMSFAAVVALIAAFEAAREWRRRRMVDAGWTLRVGYYLLDLSFTSLIAMLATAPYAVFHFNRFADYALLANLLAVPLTGIWIMPWAVIASVLMPFGLEALALAPMGWGIDLMLAIAHGIAGLPGAVAVIPSLPMAGLVAVTLGGLWLCLWERRWRLLGVAGIAIGFATIPLQDHPDILVSGDGRLMAVRGEDGRLLLSSARAARFDADLWLRRSGQDERLAWPDQDLAAAAGLACDELGCLYRRAGQVVALAFQKAALEEDCAVADLVLSLDPVSGDCAAPLVVDRFDLWRKGGHAVWLSEGRIEILAVSDTRGVRPWVVEPRPRPKRLVNSAATAPPAAPAP